jgi:hypothetical protein
MENAEREDEAIVASHMTAMAIQFMVGHRVHSLVIDGAEIKRV